MRKNNSNQLTMFGADSICNENSLFFGMPVEEVKKPAENELEVKEVTIKGQKALEVGGGRAHYVEIEKVWYSVNGGHFDGHLGGIRWDVDLEFPGCPEDRALVKYLERTRIKRYEILPYGSDASIRAKQ